MKKYTFIITLILFSCNLLSAQTWDIIDKSMSAWNVNGGNTNNKAWKTSQSGSGITVKQEASHVNITKTNIAATNNYAFLIPEALTLSPYTAYSIAVKARVNPINKTTYPDTKDNFESNQISARLNKKNLAIHLKYGDENNGYICITAASTHEDKDKYKINTSEWHVYRFVLHADNSKYDVYVDEIEDPIFENVPTTSMDGTNILRLGAESTHRCNMDIEYAKMGTGAFYSKPKIVSVVLNAEGQAEEYSKTITATVYTVAINDNEKLLVSLVDGEGKTVVNAIETTVVQNKAVTNFTIPAGLPRGKYFVKASAPNGKIGGINAIPQTAEYRITVSAFEGKNLATFGNSITSAANSWAYHVQKNLRFANLYNGAISAAIWYKRERVVAGQTIWTQNYYDTDFAGISSVAPTGENVLEHQRRINNCAIVHLQKYFIELDKKTAPTPDVIIFSYGTNDELFDYTMGTAEDALKEKELSKVNIFTMAGAVRWSIDTLQIKFPNAKIYVALPLQSSREGKNDGNLKKMEIIKKICDARSVPYFDCFYESGINMENLTTYMGDGLHPNEAGKVVHGEYITKKLEEVASNSQSNDIRNVVTEKEISISTNILNTGQNLSVKSLTNKSSLSKVALYGIAGNEVSRKSISGNEYTFQAPTTSGLYVMTVNLDNNTSKAFKILVK